MKRSRVLPSLIITMSSAGLFIDKIIPNAHFKNNFGYDSTASFLWVLFSSLIPIVICICSAFKPFRISYVVPIYIYTIQLFFLFSDSNPKSNDRDYIYFYCFGTVFLYIVLIFLYNKFLKKEEELRLRVTLLEAILDLSIMRYE
jgi:hypothetical protein